MPGKVTAMHPATHTSPVGGLLAALAITGVIAFIWYRIRRPRAAAWSPSYTNVTHEHRGPGPARSWRSWRVACCWWSPRSHRASPPP